MKLWQIYILSSLLDTITTYIAVFIIKLPEKNIYLRYIFGLFKSSPEMFMIWVGTEITVFSIIYITINVTAKTISKYAGLIWFSPILIRTYASINNLVKIFEAVPQPYYTIYIAIFPLIAVSIGYIAYLISQIIAKWEEKLQYL